MAHTSRELCNCTLKTAQEKQTETDQTPCITREGKKGNPVHSCSFTSYLHYLGT